MVATAVIEREHGTVSRRLVSLDRLGGLGGLVFVATLIIQNALRAKAPGFNAGPAQVSSYFADHRAAALVPLGLFPVGMLGLFAFVATVWRRAPEKSQWLANLGVFGATAVGSLFAVVNVTEIVLTAKGTQLASSRAVVQALWTTHAAAFGLDLAAIAITLVGLSQAAAARGLIPRWLRMLTIPGAACLFIASVFTVGLADGGPWLVLGLIGFIVWGVFVLAAGISLLRTAAVR